MLAAALKDRIKALPGGQFVQVWECIETIDGALEKAGPTAVLALNYVRALHEERLAQLLRMQERRIAHLVDSSLKQHENILSLATSRNAEIDKVAKLEKRLARLRPAKKIKNTR